MRAGRAVLVAAVVALGVGSTSSAIRAEEPHDAADATLALRIRGALARATSALAIGGAPKPEKRGRVWFAHDPRSRPLVALALLRAGNAEQRKTARVLVDDWWDDAIQNRGGVGPGTYELALEIMALEGLSLERIEEKHPRTVSRFEAKPIAPDVSERLKLATQALIGGKVATEGGGIGWGYNCAPIQGGAPSTTGAGADPLRRLAGRIAGHFDNSNTQFAVLALHDAARAGIPVPLDVAKGIARHFTENTCEPFDEEVRRLRGPDGPGGPGAPPGGPGQPPRTATGKRPPRFEWGYGARIGRGGGTPSMTYAGLSSLAIARELIGAHGRDPALDKVIEKGLLGVTHYVPSTLAGEYKTNNGFGSSYHYYSLEKALDLLDVKQVDGKDWFAAFARKLLDAQKEDGLWGGDTIDSSLNVLFLVRATISKSRLKDSRATGGGGGAGNDSEVFLQGSKKTVDAAALVNVYANEGGERARAAASAAIHALEAEGHGREASILGVLRDLVARGGERGTQGGHWLKELCGHAPTAAELERDAADFAQLHEARDPAKLRAALLPGRLVPLRAWAATALAALPCPDATWDVLAAARALDEKTLATKAGSNAARAFADALTALTQSALPQVPHKGLVTGAALQKVTAAASEKLLAHIESAVNGGFDAYAGRQQNPGGWAKAKRDVKAAGPRALSKLLDIAVADPARAPAAFALLRGATGELIPDDVDAWKGYLGGR